MAKDYANSIVRAFTVAQQRSGRLSYNETSEERKKSIEKSTTTSNHIKAKGDITAVKSTSSTEDTSKSTTATTTTTTTTTEKLEIKTTNSTKATSRSKSVWLSYFLVKSFALTIG